MSNSRQRPSLPISRRHLAGLTGAAVARALGIALLAEALARGIGVVGRQDWALIWALTLLGVLLRGGASYAAPAVASSAAADVASSRRAQLLAARLSRPHERGDIGDVTLATRGMRDMTPYFSQFIPAAVNSAVIPPILILRIGWADLPSALIVMITLPLVPVFMILIGKYTAGRTQELSQSIRQLSEHVAELARGLAVLVSLGQSERQRRGLTTVSRRYTAAVMESLRVAFLSSLALELIATMSVALVAVVIGLRLLTGDISLYAGLVALVIAPECFTPLREVGQAYHAAEDGQLALKRAEQVTSAPAKTSTESHSMPREGVFAEVQGDLFRGERLLLSGLDLRIEAAPGLTVLMGPSGAGKSSILEALEHSAPAPSASGDASLMYPEAPRVEGVLAAVPAICVPQLPNFTEETAAEELALYSGSGHDASGAAAAGDSARAQSLLAALSLESVADRSIAEYSPGEQRRLSLIRSILAAESRSLPLVLDEPTSQLDESSAAAVRALLAALGAERRVVVVTHDRRLAEAADQVLTLGAPVAASLPEHRSISAHSSSPAHHAGENDDAAARGTEPRDGHDIPSADEAERAGSPQRSDVSRLGDGAALDGVSRLRGVPSLFKDRNVLLGLVQGIVSAGCAAALTALSGWLIVRASQAPAIMYLSVAIVGVRAFGIFRAAARYGERLSTHRGMLDYAADLRLRLWDALSATPRHWRSISRRDGGSSLLVTEVDALRDAAPRALVPAVSAASVALGSFVVFAAISPALLWIPVLSVLCAGGLASWVTILAERNATTALSRHDTWLNNRLTVIYRAAADLAGGKAAGRVLEQFAAGDARYGRALRSAQRSRGIGALIVVAVQGVCAAAVLQSSGIGSPGGLPLEAAAALALLQIALIDPYIGLLDALPQWRAWVSSRERLSRALAVEPDPSMLARRELADTLDGLGSRDLSAAYEDGPVIGPVTARAQRGEWLVVTGPSGSGKSTYLDVLAGFTTPASGEVIGGKTADWIPVAGFGRVTWCPQDAYIFDAPIAGNLRLAKAEATDDELRAVLDLVGLPGMSLDTPAGPGGSWLSGGERQRLSVARGLLRGTDVFLFDEPTAYLDHDGAVRLTADLARVLTDKTVITVAHGDFAEQVPAETVRTVSLG